MNQATVVSASPVSSMSAASLVTMRAPALVRAGFRVAGSFAPGVVGQFVARRIFTPGTRTRGNQDRGPSAVKQRISFGGGELATYEWGGAGPLVLLVHGWQGSTKDYASLVPHLLEAGFRVAAFDAPAHGSSSGTETDVREMARAILAVTAYFGLPHAIVAHSVGAAATAVYLAELADGHVPTRLVLLAPGGDLEDELARISQSLDLPARAADALRKCVERRYQRPVSSCSTRNALTGFVTPLLLVHDELDRVVPISDTLRLCDAIPHAHMMRTRGLGHRRVLQDSVVIQRISDFLKE
jgi:pimeloyl-ACP methyl ester carboxylesterase